MYVIQQKSIFVSINNQQTFFIFTFVDYRNIIVLVRNMDKKTDLRIIKTKKVLFDALISLLEEMPFEEIKISDICDRALINRSTFYSHYQDKYELLSNYIYELKNALTEDLNKNDSSNNPREYYMQMISIFLDHIESKKDIYKTIMRNNKDSIVLDMVYDAFKIDVEKRIDNMEKDNKKHIPSTFVAKFYLGAIFGIGMEYLSNDSKYTKEELLKYLEKLLPDNLHIEK